MCVCAYLDKPSVYVPVLVRIAQNKGALWRIHRSCQMCDMPPFSHHRLVGDEWHFAELKSFPKTSN